MWCHLSVSTARLLCTEQLWPCTESICNLNVNFWDYQFGLSTEGGGCWGHVKVSKGRLAGASISPKVMMHIAYPPLFPKIF